MFNISYLVTIYVKLNFTIMNKEKSYLEKIAYLKNLLETSRSRATLLFALSKNNVDKSQFNQVYDYLNDSIFLLDMILEDVILTERYDNGISRCYKTN